jgi:deoxyadenosine/deoxycytidine kinase
MGVGKTSLAARLAHELGYRLVLESPETNPFLPLMYRDRRRWAFHAQVAFLLDRWKQLAALAQGDLFAPGVVADYFFEKDRIFAEINLSEQELELYLRLEEGIAGRLPRPDALVYLRASLPRLVERVRRRGIAYEMSEGLERYLEAISEAYARRFREPAGVPVLAVDTDEMDLSFGGGELGGLIAALRSARPGLTRFEPAAAASAGGKPGAGLLEKAR